MTVHSATATVLSNDGTFGAPGAELYRVTVAPRDAASTRACLVIVHGYGDHAGRYSELMSWLAARGVACHAFDLRGHGRSAGRRGYVRRWDDYLDDLRAFLALPEMGDAPGRPPLFVLGHSHGGLVVAAAGVRGVLPAHVAGCVLSAPYLLNCLPVPAIRAAAAHALNLIVPWLRIKSGVRPGMMSADPAQVEQSRQDPLLLRSATPRWFLTHRPVQAEVMARADRFTLPLLVLGGDADPIADPRGAREFHDRARSADKRLVVYAGFRHEPFRERGRERVFADVLEWVSVRSTTHRSHNAPP